MSQSKRIKSFGFTLLEVIIVVVIIGVLASLAIPRFGSMIERARGAEALTNLSEIRSAIYRCYVMTRNMGACESASGNPFERIGMADPAGSPNSHFSYTLKTIDDATHKYLIYATRTTYELVSEDPGGQISCGPWAMLNSSSRIAICESEGPGVPWYQQYGSGFYDSIH